METVTVELALGHLNIGHNELQIHINSCPTRCKKAVYLLFCKFTPHVSGVDHTHHQEYTKL